MHDSKPQAIVDHYNLRGLKPQMSCFQRMYLAYFYSLVNAHSTASTWYDLVFDYTPHSQTKSDSIQYCVF